MSREKMLKDLARSGITRRHAVTLKVKPLAASGTEKLGHFAVASYLIPYFGIDGKRTGYYRVRYLEEPVGKFGEHFDKAPRYSGPTDEPPQAYFSPVVKWRNPVATNVSETLWLTEGEKKATAACLAGVHCIGLGGVAMFQARKRGFDFLPELEAITWAGREVVIAFDSDKATNHNILREQHTLASRLMDRGAKVSIADIPEIVPGEKAGLDDFLYQFNAKERADAMQALADSVEPYETSAELWALQDELAYIRKHGGYYHFEQEKLINNLAFLEGGAYANRFYDEPAPTEHDPDKTKPVNVFKGWREWPNRREHNDIVYAPGEPPVAGDNDLNIWSGWGVEPKAGSVKPFVKLVEFLMRNEPGLLTWFWQWLAYPIQHPGFKMYSAVVMHGPKQGTGKTFLGELVGDMYGDNFDVLSQDDLESDFNDAFTRKQFCLADEVIGAGNRKQADKMKAFITRQTIRINRKFEAKYKLADTINYLFTSNHFDAVYVERDDRRYAVVEVPYETLPNKFYNELRAWREAGGPAHLMHHLLQVDLTGFEPLGRPPETESHSEMVETSFSDLDAWAEALKRNPDSILSIGGSPSPKTFFTPPEALQLYDPGGMKRTQSTALGRSLKKAGFAGKTCSGYNDKGERIGQRLWALRAPEKWNKVSSGRWFDEWKKQNPDNLRDKFT